MPIDAPLPPLAECKAGWTGRWFIYYRIHPANLSAVLSAVQRLQEVWCQQHPGARAAVLCREPGPDRLTLTLMEIYAPAPGMPADGQSPALQALESSAQQVLAPWLQGGRHLEVFAPCA